MEEKNTPYIGTNGTWYIDNEDIGIKAQDAAGIQAMKNENPELVTNLNETIKGGALEADGSSIEFSCINIDYAFTMVDQVSGNNFIASTYNPTLSPGTSESILFAFDKSWENIDKIIAVVSLDYLYGQVFIKSKKIVRNDGILNGHDNVTVYWANLTNNGTSTFTFNSSFIRAIGLMKQ